MSTVTGLQAVGALMLEVAVLRAGVAVTSFATGALIVCSAQGQALPVCLVTDGTVANCWPFGRGVFLGRRRRGGDRSVSLEERGNGGGTSG